MSTAISIPCPNCQTQIPADSNQLLLGVQFSCPNCQSTVGLSKESKPIVEETMKKFNELKNKVNKEEK